MEVFLCYSQFLVKGDFVIGGVLSVLYVHPVIEVIMICFTFD